MHVIHVHVFCASQLKIQQVPMSPYQAMEIARKYVKTQMEVTFAHARLVMC